MSDDRRDPTQPTRRTLLPRDGGRREGDRIGQPMTQDAVDRRARALLVKADGQGREASEVLLRAHVAAQRLGVHVKTVRTYYRSGKLRCVRTAAGGILIPESAIAEFLLPRQ